MIGPCIAAKSHHACPRWVKTGKSRSEQMLSALPPLATGERTFWVGSFVPIAAVSRCSNMHMLPTTYSITSSAATISLSGTLRPSAFAVLRLIVNWTLTGSWTGSSLGFVPCKMRSA